MIRIYVILAAAAALLVGAVYVLTSIYDAGKDAGVATQNERIIKDNDHAGQTAEQCRAVLRRCNDSGGVYDFANCTCDR